MREFDARRESDAQKADDPRLSSSGRRFNFGRPSPEPLETRSSNRLRSSSNARIVPILEDLETKKTPSSDHSDLRSFRLVRTRPPSGETWGYLYILSDLSIGDEAVHPLKKTLLTQIRRLTEAQSGDSRRKNALILLGKTIREDGPNSGCPTSGCECCSPGCLSSSDSGCLSSQADLAEFRTFYQTTSSQIPIYVVPAPQNHLLGPFLTQTYKATPQGCYVTAFNGMLLASLGLYPGACNLKFFQTVIQTLRAQPRLGKSIRCILLFNHGFTETVPGWGVEEKNRFIRYLTENQIHVVCIIHSGPDEVRGSHSLEGRHPRRVFTKIQTLVIPKTRGGPPNRIPIMYTSAYTSFLRVSIDPIRGVVDDVSALYTPS